MNCAEFTQLLTTNKKQAWDSVKSLINCFLGIIPADNYLDLSHLKVILGSVIF